MNHRVEKSEVDRLRAVIEQAPERAAKVSRGEALRMLAPQLRALRGRGYTVNDIVELLHGNGWMVAVDTVRACLASKRGAGARGAARPTGHAQKARGEEGKPRGVSRGSEVETAETGGSKAPAKEPGAPVRAHVPPAARERGQTAKADGPEPPLNPAKSTFTPREDSDEI
jgi:hypothetical protein